MEFINNVELAGVVGQVRKTEIGSGMTGVNFSLAVNLAFKDNDGTPVIETTWVPCIVFVRNGKETPDKGDKVRLQGRLKAEQYIDAAGADHSALRIIVKSFEKLK